MLRTKEASNLERNYYRKLAKRLTGARKQGNAKLIKKLTELQNVLRMKSNSVRCVSGGLPETNRRTH
jgi:hypothetical protein